MAASSDLSPSDVFIGSHLPCSSVRTTATWSLGRTPRACSLFRTQARAESHNLCQEALKHTSQTKLTYPSHKISECNTLVRKWLKCKVLAFQDDTQLTTDSTDLGSLVLLKTHQPQNPRIHVDTKAPKTQRTQRPIGTCGTQVVSCSKFQRCPVDPRNLGNI